MRKEGKKRAPLWAYQEGVKKGVGACRYPVGETGRKRKGARRFSSGRTLAVAENEDLLTLPTATPEKKVRGKKGKKRDKNPAVYLL